MSYIYTSRNTDRPWKQPTPWPLHLPNMLWTLAMILIGWMPKSLMPAPSSNGNAPWRVGTSADNHNPWTEREACYQQSMISWSHRPAIFHHSSPPLSPLPLSKVSVHIFKSPAVYALYCVLPLLFCYTCYFSNFFTCLLFPPLFALLYLFSCSCTACIALMRATV